MAKKIEVKVGRVGTKARKVLLPLGGTVQQSLESAGIKMKPSEDITVNGKEVGSLSYQLEAGDIVAVTRNVKGGSNGSNQ